MDYEHAEARESLVLQIVGCLIEHEYTKAKQIVSNEDNRANLITASWDLIPKICELINEDNTCIDGFVDTCKTLFQRLCDVGNVKELLLIFLEQVDRFTDHDTFITLLNPLQTCLQRLPTRRGHSLDLVIGTLYAHITTLPKPAASDLSGKERLLLVNDSAVRTIERILVPFLNFVETFISEASKNKEGASDKEKEILIKCLIKILDHPIAFLDVRKVDTEDGVDSGMRMLAIRVMHMLSTLVSNFAKYMLDSRIKLEQQQEQGKTRKAKERTDDANSSGEDEEEEEQLPELGVCTLAYLSFCEQMQPDRIPQVMTYQYWLELNIPFITHLMARAEWLVQEKGVCLLGHCIKHIPSSSLPADFLGTYRMKLLIKGLLELLCTGQNKEVNQMALKNFTNLLWCFEPSGCHKFIMFILKKSTHAGIRGYCITQLKELVDKNILFDRENNVFSGHSLSLLLKEVFVLPSGETTDLMENSAQIMAALNFLRYLVVRDKPGENITGAWDEIPNIENGFCDKLRMGINMSRAHFQMDLDKVKSGKDKQNSPELEISVGSESVPGLNKEQKLQMLSVALNTFDMIESVLGRVSELIAQAKRA